MLRVRKGFIALTAVVAIILGFGAFYCLLLAEKQIKKSRESWHAYLLASQEWSSSSSNPLVLQSKKTHQKFLKSGSAVGKSAKYLAMQEYRVEEQILNSMCADSGLYYFDIDGNPSKIEDPRINYDLMIDDLLGNYPDPVLLSFANDSVFGKARLARVANDLYGVRKWKQSAYGLFALIAISPMVSIVIFSLMRGFRSKMSDGVDKVYAEHARRLDRATTDSEHSSHQEN